MLDRAIGILSAKAGGTLLSFLSGELEYTKEVPTAAVTAEEKFTLKINPDFECEYVECPEDLAGILLHELLHVVLRHRHYPCNKLYNFCCDAWINAYINKIAPELTGVFVRFYDKNKFPQNFLRSKASNLEGKYKRLYNKLYGNPSSVAVPDIVELFKNYENEIERTTTVGGDNPPKKGEEVVEYVEKVINKNRRAGKGGELSNALSDIKYNNSLDRAARLAAMASSRGQLISLLSEDRTRTVVPSRLPRTAGAYFTMNMNPFFYEEQQNQGQNKLHVYFDVSGSVTSELDFIMGAVLALKESYELNLYQFSTQVIEVGLEEVKAGKIKSTGGTCFNCVARHIQENNIENALLFTDGCSSLSPDNIEDLQRRNIITGLIGTRDSVVKEFSRVVLVKKEE